MDKVKKQQEQLRKILDIAGSFRTDQQAMSTNTKLTDLCPCPIGSSIHANRGCEHVAKQELIAAGM